MVSISTQPAGRRVLSIGRPAATKAQKELDALVDVGLHLVYTPETIMERSKLLAWIADEIAANGGFEAILFTISKIYTLVPTDETLFAPFLPPFAPAGTLKLVTGPGAGFDKISMPYFNEHKIKYCNTPGSVAEPTALHAVILTLTTLRHTTAAERSIRRGEWTMGGTSAANKTMGVSQVGRTVGILGMGSIGKIVGRYLGGMGMRVIYHNRRQLSEEAAGGATYVPTLNEFLKQTDVLSIHVPLNDHSKGLIGAREIALLPPKSYIVNTARGPVLQTQALIDALKSGHVAGAGLDVFDVETSAGIDPYLMQSDEVTLTPHFACNIDSIYPSVESEQSENLRAWAVGAEVNVCNSWE